MDGKSLNITEDKLQQLRSLFPEVFTEDKIDFTKLRGLLGDNVNINKEHYELRWAGKTEARKEIQKQTTATLIPNRENSVDFDRAENLFIEGENLEVLRVLQKSYYDKVKMIYIDPPYNTGNDSFVYPDDYSERQDEYKKRTGITNEDGYLNKQGLWRKNSKENGQFHSVWLSMMYPRLFLARNLLKEDGVIFVSIDDNEQANLKLLMDEIFGEENYLGTFIINSTPNARDYGHIGKMHEYAYLYAKNQNKAVTNELQIKDKSFKYVDQIGGFNIHPLYNSNEAFTPDNRPNLYYPFYVNPKKNITGFHDISLEKKDGYIEVYPPKSEKNGVQFVWRWGKDKATKFLNIEIVGYKTGSDIFRIVQKMRHTSKLIRSLQLDKTFSSRRGTAEVEELFAQKIFSFPKPVELIKQFILAGSIGEEIILDFFAGSASTAHAIMNLNKEDGGDRKYIMVQMPEPLEEGSEGAKAGYKNIADISRARIQKVIKKIKEEGGDIKQNLGFKAYKLMPSNFKVWRNDIEGADAIKEQLEVFTQSELEGSECENMVYELLLKAGLPLTAKVEEIEDGVYNIDGGKLMLCFAVYSNELGEKVISTKPDKVVFLNSRFEQDKDLTNFKLQLKEAKIELTII